MYSLIQHSKNKVTIFVSALCSLPKVVPNVFLTCPACSMHIFTVDREAEHTFCLLTYHSFKVKHISNYVRMCHKHTGHPHQ